ncbi:dTDP-glucose 4,6-dehydratase [Blastopirellula marina]|uniref:dTDP-glucose 4,6-dehydratase n=1 Tax=Blastopirellula marina TaxID=124 RepID=UPI0018ECC46B|nr:dTDP-glucose 4,6-dehydratase [Blastopirellula marina]
MLKTILVTGGAGFIGGCFVRQMLDRTGYRVITLDKLTYAGIRESIPSDSDRHVFAQGDIGDTGLVHQLLAKYEPFAVVNFAAESHVDRSIDGPRQFVETNVLKTFDLLHTTHQWWKGLTDDVKAKFRFLHVSTDEVYGSADDGGKFTETTPYSPNSPYSASKAASDFFVRAMQHTYGFPTLTTNCSNNYGPYQFPEKLIPLMILNALSGKPLPVYGDGKNIRDWLYVEDHCTAIATVLEKGRLGETYNVGGNSERTNLDIVHTICDSLDAISPMEDGSSRRNLIKFVTDRPGHDRRYAIDCSKLTSELGWEPQETLETGMSKTIRWYLDNPEWLAIVQAKHDTSTRLGQGDAPAQKEVAR